MDKLSQISLGFRKELTVRGIALGIVITLVLTAANVYFGLKAGLTFATSIPATVVSMTLLRRLANSTIQENNIVQTLASAAGTLSSIIFVLPGLVMIGWWTGFPFFVSFAICALGGILGVMYSIPLRRALVVHSDLPYPEGVACAEVLKVGGHAENGVVPDVAATQTGFTALMIGSVSSTVFALIVGTQLFASDVAHYFRFGGRNGATGFDFNLSFALFAVGHLVGLWVGLAMLTGAVISWAGAVPYFTSHLDISGSASDAAIQVWSHYVRFIGAGTIGVSAVWTLLKMIGPVLKGLSSALAASRLRKAGQGFTLARTEQDMPIGIVGLITLASLVAIAFLLRQLAVDSGLAGQQLLLVSGGVVYVALMGFFVATVCGYMAGLIGASNSPVSGLGILVVIGAALLLVVVAKPLLTAASGPGLVAFALFVTAVVFSIATISNDNLQDLKTGQLVDATPWRQQVALVIGVIAGSLVIPPVMDLLLHAYGFAGTAGVNPAHALAAPQAALISALAKGVIQGNLDWAPIRLGVVIGVVLIAVDEFLRRKTKAHLSPLAVGMGMYLPTSVSLITAAGAVAGWAYNRRAERTAEPERTQQLGTLLASGMIVGESLIGVILAAIVVFSGRSTPLALVGDSFADAGVWIGGAAFALSMISLYSWLNRVSGPAKSARL